MTGNGSGTVVPLDAEGEVLAERRGHVLIVTINRPEVRNAVDLTVTRGIGEALELADHDPEVRCVILTGSGDRAFCAGADLKAAASGELTSTDPRVARWGFAGYVQHPISTPTIAAVGGFALGGGTELVLASDLAVASERATFGLPEVKRGIFAAAGGAFRLARQIPQKAAMEAMLTGEPIPAARALEFGLVNRVVKHEDVLTTALELADRVAANAPLAVQATKRVALGIDGGGVAAEDDDWVRNAREIAAVMSSADAREGMAAFAQKREPVWTGR